MITYQRFWDLLYRKEAELQILTKEVEALRETVKILKNIKYKKKHNKK